MGKILSVIPRKMQRFNIENRAHKIISKDKPTPAPRYPGTITQVERYIAEHPEILEEGSKKNEALTNRLKEVFVVSHTLNINVNTQENRPLPQSRVTVVQPELGFFEPEIIPKGRITLHQALKFIGDRQADPQLWTVEKISEQYSLSSDAVSNIVKYFHTFEIYLPPVKGGGKLSISARPRNVRKIEGSSDS